MGKLKEAKTTFYKKKALGNGTVYCWQEIWSETGKFSSDKAISTKAEKLQKMIDEKKLKADGWLVDRIKIEILTKTTKYDSIMGDR